MCAMTFKTGFVAIVGRPNAGKSTLVNRLVGQKVAIVSPRPQTTRNRIQGIINRNDAQIVLIDTPGIHKPENALGQQMMHEVRDAVEGIDVLLLIVDAAEADARHAREERFALHYVKRATAPTILLLNKIDRIDKRALLPLMERYSKEHQFAEVIPISALDGGGVDDVLRSIIARLPEGEPQFPTGQYTDQPERFLAGEIVREKALLATRKEVPHAVAVLVDSFEESEKIIRIRATIYVEREGQKGILIGKAARTLKKIGTDARIELEELLGIKIFLELFVKVQPNWRQNRSMVRQLDWHTQLEEMGEGTEEESEDDETTDEH
jgi:GTP-binding protein Era